MKNAEKYAAGYYPVKNALGRWMYKDHVEKPPVWCSVDLRDGNQSLVVPMGLTEKLEFFSLLCSLGFKEIEVGFPAASETEYIFLRTLIEKDLIPKDVTVQVLTQCREHIIRRTFEALEGAPSAVVHFYNPTSAAQREQVFRKSKAEIKEIATESARLVKALAKEYRGNFRFEYSPESFTGTEPDYALEVCNGVLDVLKPTEEKPVIINLPVTVELSMPHIYANQIEYISDRLNARENVTLSLHPHNDRGCGVADAEFGLLAGADRVEGTLFGNGERTGNVDLVTLALNMYAHGVDPKLDFSNLPQVIDVYERTTGMRVYERQPYGGALVFAAFSGSHQDAIAKGMKWRQEQGGGRWNVPYLLIDPKDVGREYNGDVIRINSQSGKGGIGYLMEQRFGYDLPPKMREDFGYTVKGISDRQHKELTPEEVCRIFEEQYINRFDPIDVTEAHFVQGETSRSPLTAAVTVELGGRERRVFSAMGNGRLDAVSNALKANLGLKFRIITYKEHALEQGSSSQAIAYVGIASEDGSMSWGAGTHSDIMSASVNALVSAINRRPPAAAGSFAPKTERDG